MKYLDKELNDREAVLQALGAASVAWTPDGVFIPDMAVEIADELIDNWIKKPRLGYATTIELINELAARVEISAVTGEAWPNYTTVAVP